MSNKLDFNKEITTLQGDPILMDTSSIYQLVSIIDKAKPEDKIKDIQKSLNHTLTMIKNDKATFGKLFINKLMSTEDKSLSGEDKLKYFMLAEKIYKSKEPEELTIDEISILKKIVEKIDNVQISAKSLMFLPK